jgi:hypothetical protein
MSQIIQHLMHFFQQHILNYNLKCVSGQKYVLFTEHLNFPSRQGSSVGISIGYGLDGPRIESRCGEIFRTCPDRPGPTQPPVLWVPGLSRG